MAEEEAHSLYDGHDRKHDADGCRALCINHADKEGVGHIIQVGDQHGYDGRDSHGANNPGHRCLGQEGIIVTQEVLGFGCKGKVTPKLRQSRLQVQEFHTLRENLR